MSFGFSEMAGGKDEDGNVKKRRWPKKPLSDMSWDDIKVGLRVQSVLTDVYGKLTIVDKPYLQISWENGNVSNCKLYDTRVVDVVSD